MTVQIFMLRGVPDDEAEDVRKLLTAHAIDYYETPAGNWGISMPALWLNNEYQYETARALIEEYETERLAKAKDEYLQLRRAGRHRTILHEIKEHPVRVVTYLAIAIVVLYFSTMPFIDLGQ